MTIADISPEYYRTEKDLLEMEKVFQEKDQALIKYSNKIY